MGPIDFFSRDVPLPDRFILFAPHPDDIAISMGALAAHIARLGVPTTIVLVTDGSEARLPDNVIREAAGDGGMPAEELTRIRGRIRVAEAQTEADLLGFSRSCVRLLEGQTWFTAHRTPAAYLNPDLSLANVDGFEPGEIDQANLDEVSAAIGSGTGVICAVPDPADRLTMHRITTDIVNRCRGNARLLTYECLSTIEPTGPQTIFGFDDDLLAIKCEAICAHRSMKERRKQFGGYSNSGSEFYDALVRRRNADLARSLNLSVLYAERFGWM